MLYILSDMSYIGYPAVVWKTYLFFQMFLYQKYIHDSIECLVVCHLSVFGTGTSEKKGMFSKQRRGIQCNTYQLKCKH